MSLKDAKEIAGFDGGVLPAVAEEKHPSGV
jgi:hypothetical protein